MARPKQAIINDLMGELDKFGGHITNIRDAIQSKGVTSEGKLFKFAEEINSIEPASTYGYILDAVKGAYSKGYSDSELVGIINNLANKNQPPQPQPEPNPAPAFDAATATEIPARQFYGRSDLEGELTCPNVVKVGAEAFSGCEYSVVNLPKATEIDKEAFFNSYVLSLNIPNFVWKDNNLNIKGMYDIVRLNKVIVADESVPPSDLGLVKPSMEVYNHDSTKIWDVYRNVWKPV
jgi:putative lysine--tRNA ligase